jgi:coenzyme PQQ precursor peptide PqqA
MGVTMNLLICRCFDGELQKTVNLSRIAAKKGLDSPPKISLANFSFGARLSNGRMSSEFEWRAKMAWKTPKIVEVSVGMEINMYACAARK